VPVFGKLGIGLAASGVDKVAYSMTGFGLVPKTETSLIGGKAWTLADALNSDRLSAVNRQTVLDAMKADPRVVCLYIDGIYAMQSATYVVSHARSLQANESVDAATVLTETGAYTFNNQSSSTITVLDDVENFRGYPFRLGEVAVPGGGTILEIQESPVLPQEVANAAAAAAGKK
jgi:hypothetical protein